MKEEEVKEGLDGSVKEEALPTEEVALKEIKAAMTIGGKVGLDNKTALAVHKELLEASE